MAENQRLRMENEYLKKLNALVQEKKNQAREQEKVIVVNELRQKYSLRELLKLAEMPRSTFYYHLNNLKKEDKYKVEKRRNSINIP